MDKQTILDILSALGIDVHKAKVSGEHLSMLCPFHDDSDPSFSILLAAGGPWMCFGCGTTGKHMGEMIREYEALHGPQPHARELWQKDKTAYLTARGLLKGQEEQSRAPMTREEELAELENKLRAMEWDETKARDDRLKYEYDLIPESEYRQYARPAKYFTTRGFTDQTCEYWNLGDDEGFQRALIPIRDFQGGLVGVQGRSYAINCKCGLPFAEWMNHPRAVKNSAGKIKLCPVCNATRPMKYLTSTGLQKSLFLFGEHMLERDYREAIIVESPMSVLWLWQHGYQNALATMGSIPSEHQVRKLQTWFYSVFLFADGDARTHPRMLPAGERWKQYLQFHLGRYLTVRHRTCPVGKDPADLTADQLRYVLGDPTGIRTDIRTRAKDDPGRQVSIYI